MSLAKENELLFAPKAREKAIIPLLQSVLSNWRGVSKTTLGLDYNFAPNGGFRICTLEDLCRIFKRD